MDGMFLMFCHRERLLEASKHPNGLRFFNCRWRNDQKNATRALQKVENIPETVYKSYIQRNGVVRKN